MSARKKSSKKKTGATRNTEHKSSALTWMVMGLLVGLFVAFLVHLDKIPTQGTDQDTVSGQDKSEAAKQKESETSVQKSSQPKAHQFDFYTVLPDREVEIIEVEETPAKKPSSKTPPGAEKEMPRSDKNKSAVPAMSLYQLQVGAFKELKKADAMKARLAFLGVESNIQVVHNNGQKMYRVRVGPSTDSQKINRIKAQLKAQNINTFVQKL